MLYEPRRLRTARVPALSAARPGPLGTRTGCSEPIHSPHNQSALSEHTLNTLITQNTHNCYTSHDSTARVPAAGSAAWGTRVGCSKPIHSPHSQSALSEHTLNTLTTQNTHNCYTEHTYLIGQLVPLQLYESLAVAAAARYHLKQSANNQLVARCSLTQEQPTVVVQLTKAIGTHRCLILVSRIDSAYVVVVLFARNAFTSGGRRCHGAA